MQNLNSIRRALRLSAVTTVIAAASATGITLAGGATAQAAPTCATFSVGAYAIIDCGHYPTAAACQQASAALGGRGTDGHLRYGPVPITCNGNETFAPGKWVLESGPE